MYFESKLMYDANPDQIGKALAESTPEEFAAVWLVFSEHIKNTNKLNVFAKEMAKKLGANRKYVIYDLVDLIKYFEKQEQFDKIVEK